MRVARARKPANVDHATAASLPLVSPGTAWEALHLRAPNPTWPDGNWYTPARVASGTSQFKLARLYGCRVITTAGRDESIAFFCRDVLHADEVINYRTEGWS